VSTAEYVEDAKYHQSGAGPREDFVFVASDEPHASRRKEMLSKYPQIKQLYGYDPTSKYKALLSVLLQWLTAYVLVRTEASWLSLLLVAYVWGGTINHSLMLAVHELSHDLFFPQRWANEWFGLLVNTPMAVPLSAGFKKYHLVHHRYQGLDGVDPDLPSAWEGAFFRNPLTKFFFILLQPFIYIFRPLLTYPSKTTRAEVIATVGIVLSNWAALHFLGVRAPLYFFLSTILGSGVHPLAGHFIAEHYVWTPGFETFSYYGPINLLVYNVGYHNEHHDFPRIPGSRLPQLHAIAPEYYSDQAIGKLASWPATIWRFITDPDITPFSRVKRAQVQFAPALDTM
jgi:sphingolipid delta-4 desaturase